jgi:hypothetical protein
MVMEENLEEGDKLNFLLDKKDFTDIDVLSILAFLLGLFSTFEAFKINIREAHIYPYTLIFIFFFLCLVVRFLYLKKVDILKDGKITNIFLIILSVYFGLIIFSVIIPLLDNADYFWVFVYLKASIKFFAIFIFIWLIFTNYHERIFSLLFKGFFISLIIQILWGILQLGYWYIFNINLNEILLGNKLGIDPSHTWANYVIFPIVRITGLHWDPAYLGVWSLMCTYWIILFCNNKFHKYFFSCVTTIVFINTFSRSALFALSMIVFILFLNKIIIFLSQWRLRFKLNKKILLFFLIILTVCIVSLTIIELSGYFPSKVFIRLTNFSAAGNQRHLNYFKAGLFAISDSIPHLIFGYGYRNGMRGLQQLPNVESLLPGFHISKSGVSTESDFVNSYLELGLLGFIIHLLIFIIGIIYLTSRNKQYYRLMKKGIINKLLYNNKKKRINFGIFCYMLLFFSGFFYSYKDSFWYWLVIILPFFMLREEREDIE